MSGSTYWWYNITEWQIGAVDVRNNNANILSLNTPTVSHSPFTSKALPDTVATSHYLHPSTLPHCSHVAHTTSGPTVQVANGNIIKLDFSSTLQILIKLSSRAQSADVFNDTKTGLLVSMALLYDDDCVAIFTKFDVKILKHDRVIITGLQDRTNRL